MFDKKEMLQHCMRLNSILSEAQLDQSGFNNAYDRREQDRIHGSVSEKDKWNLKMDVLALKDKLNDLQDTAEALPDVYVEQLCSVDSYPFEEVIDDSEELEDWCDDMDEFLSGSTGTRSEPVYRRR